MSEERKSKLLQLPTRLPPARESLRGSGLGPHVFRLQKENVIRLDVEGGSRLVSDSAVNLSSDVLVSGRVFGECLFLGDILLCAQSTRLSSANPDTANAAPQSRQLLIDILPRRRQQMSRGLLSHTPFPPCWAVGWRMAPAALQRTVPQAVSRPEKLLPEATPFPARQPRASILGFGFRAPRWP